MFQVLRFHAESSYAVINAALTLHPAHSLAIVFPAGARPQIATSGQLSALFARTQALGKDVTIVGGDTELRVAAVAAGFAAATTIDDWKLGKRFAAQSVEARGRRDANEEAGLLMLEPEPERHDLNGSGGSWLAEPPLHIATLLETREQQSRITPPMHKFTDAELDARDAEAVLQASERYEDDITARIRATSELDISWAI